MFNSAREEILRLSIERLNNKVESIMFSINIILSNPDKAEKPVDKVTELLIEFSVAENALVHAKSLLTQSLEQKMRELESLHKDNKTDQ
jgi:hypothetical protein